MSLYYLEALKQHITETQQVNISLAKCTRVVYVGEQKSERKFSYFVMSTEGRGQGSIASIYLYTDRLSSESWALPVVGNDT